MQDLYETALGYEFLDDNFYLLFGNQNLNDENYEELISLRLDQKLKFYDVDQVHGDGIYIPAKDHPAHREADAILLQNKNQMARIQTADCLPIALINSYSKEAALIHAGWRGVFHEIAPKALGLFQNQDSQYLQVIIGPHIAFSSYQVGEEIIECFGKKFDFFTAGIHYANDPLKDDHYLLNLQEILISQLEKQVGQALACQRSKINTYHNRRFHSYRRDGQRAGRNLSFLMLR